MAWTFGNTSVCRKANLLRRFKEPWFESMPGAEIASYKPTKSAVFAVELPWRGSMFSTATGSVKKVDRPTEVTACLLGRDLQRLAGS